MIKQAGLVSVIVPIYKVENYIRRCVDSILAQTYTDLEIILVDDGSPDKCPAICDEYAELDSRIKVIHKQNGGLSDARNAGISVARGEWLSFVDSDDLIEPDMYEGLLKNALEHNAQMSVGGVNDEIRDGDNVKVIKTTFDGEEKIESLTPIQAMKKHLLGSWAAWDKIYRREIFDGIWYAVGEINEDEPLMLKLLDRCENIVYTNKIYYHYIHRPESITTSSFSVKKLIWIKHCKDNLEWIREHHPELEADAAKRWCGSLLWAMREMVLSNESFKNEISNVRKEIKENYKLLKNLNLNKKEKIRLRAARFLPSSLYRAFERALIKMNGAK